MVGCAYWPSHHRSWSRCQAVTHSADSQIPLIDDASYSSHHGSRLPVLQCPGCCWWWELIWSKSPLIIDRTAHELSGERSGDDQATPTRIQPRTNHCLLEHLVSAGSRPVCAAGPGSLMHTIRPRSLSRYNNDARAWGLRFELRGCKNALVMKTQ